MLGEALHGALVAALDHGTDQRRGESLAARDSQPGGFEGDRGSPARKLGQRVGPGQDAAAPADVALHVPRRPLVLRPRAVAVRAPVLRALRPGPARRPHTAEFLDGIIDDWLEPLVAATVARGIPEPRARAHTRLGVAVTRGLLLDLLATGDTEAADQAMDAFIALTERWLETNAARLPTHLPPASAL